MADEFDDLSPDEAEALKAHLAKMRKKKELEAKLAKAKAEAEALAAELGEIDGVEFSEGDEWDRIEHASPEERHRMAEEQARLAEEFRREQAITGSHDGPRSEFLRRAWGVDEIADKAKRAEDALARSVRPGDRSLVEQGIMPTGHGRVARRAEDFGQEHKPGALSSTTSRSAKDELGPGYQDNVRVIQHRFKNRAWNPRTRVDDTTLPELRKKHRLDDE